MMNYISEIELNNINFRLDEDDAWWYDADLYDESQEKGVFFGYTSNWDSLFSGNDPDDASYLYLCVDFSHLKKKSKKIEFLCVNLCVKNVPKSAKMWKIDQNLKMISPAFTASYVI